MLDYFLKQLEKDIYICNRVIEYNTLNSYQIRNEIEPGEYDDVREIEIENICHEMLVLYEDEIYFSCNDYLNIKSLDLDCLKLMTKLMDKYRNSILDKDLINKLKRDIDLYKKEKIDYQERIDEYKKQIQSYRDYIELLKKNLEIKSNNLINVYQHQEVATTIDIETQINNKFLEARRRVLYDDLEDKEELLKRLDDLEKIMQEGSAEEVKESKIKSTLSWLGTKGKNTIELLMPLIQLILEKKL